MCVSGLWIVVGAVVGWCSFWCKFVMQWSLMYSHYSRLHVYCGSMDCLRCDCGLIVVLVLICHATVIDLFSLESIECLFRVNGLFLVCVVV